MAEKSSEQIRIAVHYLDLKIGGAVDLVDPQDAAALTAWKNVRLALDDARVPGVADDVALLEHWIAGLLVETSEESVGAAVEQAWQVVLAAFMTPAPGEFPKRCANCRAILSEADWLRLPMIGVQVDPVETLELRNCSCGSTLAITVLSILDEEV